MSATDDPDVGHGVHLFGTLLAAAGRQQRRGRVSVAAADVRRAIREGREGNLVIFVVDASGSMAARDRMAAVGGATLSLLRDAYQRRDKVAVITFRGQRADLVLPPTSSVHIASRRLARFDTGGKTPLAEGLLAARDVVVREKVRDRARRSLVVVLTDGRATGGPDPLGRTRRAAGLLLAEGAAAVVVDCETSYVRLGLAEDLAKQLGAPSVRLAQLRADALTRLVTSRRISAPPDLLAGETFDAAGPTAHRSRRRADHQGPSQCPVARGAHRARQGEVHRGVRHGAARLESGFRRRGVPVRQERQVEGGRGGRLSRTRPPARRTRHRRPGAVAQDGLGLVMVAQARAPTSTTPPRPPTAGPRSRGRLAEERHDFYVLDEFTYPLKWGWVDADEVVATLASRPGNQHVVITGRDAPPRLLDAADLVTEMTKVKHPMDAGRKGQRGIEW